MSEAGTSNSSVDEDSPRLKPQSFFKFVHSDTNALTSGKLVHTTFILVVLDTSVNRIFVGYSVLASLYPVGINLAIDTR